MIAVLLVCLALGVYYHYVRQKEQKVVAQVTPISRGERSEHRLILDLIRANIDPRAIFHDLYIEKDHGHYAQIDVAVPTKAGIIVFEVKEYSGWIFGNEHQDYWTQVLAYGAEKHRFYNPVKQNVNHIQVIRKCLPQNPGIPIYSVIVFYGNCLLRNITCSAENTAIIKPQSLKYVITEILSQPAANYGNKYEIMDLFGKAVQNGNDSAIVSSQIRYAAYCNRNKPRG